MQRGGWYDCRMTVTDMLELVSGWLAVVRVRKLANPKPPGLDGA